MIMHAGAASYHPQRPLSFNVLCILAFGFGGFSILVNLFLIISGSLSYSFREIAFIEQMLGSAVSYTGLIYSVSGLILSIIAFLGVIQIWNQMRSGFWVFSIAKIIYLFIPFLLLDLPASHLFYLMLPFSIMVGFFIVLFSFNLRYLR